MRMIFWLYGVLVVTFALGSIQATESGYQVRQMMSKIQAVKVERDQMRLEWSQLALERATMKDEAQLYHVAQKSLGMALPTSQKVVFTQ